MIGLADGYPEGSIVVLGETLMRASSRSLPRGAAINQQTTLMQPVSCIVLDALPPREGVRMADQPRGALSEHWLGRFGRQL